MLKGARGRVRPFLERKGQTPKNFYKEIVIQICIKKSMSKLYAHAFSLVSFLFREKESNNFLKKVSLRLPSKTFLTERFLLRRLVKQKDIVFS